MSLHDDEVGSIYTMDVVFTTLLLVLGAIAGLTSYRDAISQELGDTSVALQNIDQSFSYQLNGADGLVLRDQNNVVIGIRMYMDPATTLLDPVGAPPAGLSITTPATAE